MTNLLYWNIRNFAIRKINDPRGGVAPNTGGLTYAVASLDRRAIIMAEIAATTADIIAIVEVGTGNTAGDLATNSGGLQGAQRLLNLLRAANAAAEWRMVPPLWLGSRTMRTVGGLETVAVLYRGVTVNALAGNVTRYFTGPNYWSGGAGGVSTNPPVGGGGVPANYPPALNLFLAPPGTVARAIPVGSPYRPSTALVQSWETQSAARIYYVRPSVKRPRGGVPYNPSMYGGFRPPYMTSFYEVNALTGATRTLTLFSIHAPPGTRDARTLMNFFAQTNEISSAPLGGEIKILAGDFNLNFLDAAGDYDDAYQPVEALGYESLLNTGAVPPVGAGPIEQFRGNFATHLSAVPTQPLPQPAADTLFLWSDPGPPAAASSYYPAYGGTSADKDTDSIDNILVRPAPLVAYPLTIMNLVTGSPFLVAVPPNNAPQGNVVLATNFTNPPPPQPFPPPPPPYWPLNPTARDFNAGDALQLTSWPNYGRVYSTSDHFGLTTTIP